MSRSRHVFVPRMVPEVRAGYYWLAKDAIGIGTTSFRVPEGNKHSTFDLVQATVASQPAALTENGGFQFRMRKSTDPSPSSNLKTAGAVIAGWTGPTYVGMWVRLPDASGDITNAGNAFFWHHSSSAPNLRLALGVNVGTPDVTQPTFSQDGTANGTARCPMWGNSNWIWLEFIFDPQLILGGTTKNDKLKWFFNIVQQALTTNPTPDFTSIHDSSAQIGIACRLSTGLSNLDTMDWATCYYANGIPSLKNRKRLANYLNPSNVKFSIV